MNKATENDLRLLEGNGNPKARLNLDLIVTKKNFTLNDVTEATQIALSKWAAWSKAGVVTIEMYYNFCRHRGKTVKAIIDSKSVISLINGRINPSNKLEHCICWAHWTERLMIPNCAWHFIKKCQI